MDVCWYLKVNEKQLGPYTLNQLRYHPLLTPDSLVRSNIDPRWRLARFVPEIQSIFEDSTDLKGKGDQSDEQQGMDQTSELAMRYTQDPFQFFLWLLIVALVVFYTLLLRMNQ